MSNATTKTKVKFLIDQRGKKTHALIPIEEYERFIEDRYDNMIADSREDEETFELEELKVKLRSADVSR